jgi:hypothetical protein
LVAVSATVSDPSPLYRGKLEGHTTRWARSGAEGLWRIRDALPRDFRRTLITRLPDFGFEPFLGHKIANHVRSGVFAHYNHNTYEE